MKTFDRIVVTFLFISGIGEIIAAFISSLPKTAQFPYPQATFGAVLMLSAMIASTRKY